jgi:hypothetical protein
MNADLLDEVDDVIIGLVGVFRSDLLICGVDDCQKNLNEYEIHEKYEDSIIDRAKYRTGGDNVGECAVRKQDPDKSSSEIITKTSLCLSLKPTIFVRIRSVPSVVEIKSEAICIV